MYHKKEDLLGKLLARQEEPASPPLGESPGREVGEEAAAPGDSAALVRALQAQPPAVAVLEAVREMLPETEDSFLADLFQFALMGLSQAFSDRNLSPHLPEHLEIIPPLLKDIRAVHDKLNMMGAEVDPEIFRLRAYDYGIHKAYYLDWRLYLSKEMY